MFYSEQECYCRICGALMKIELANAPYDGQFCGNSCYEEFEWRRTLSILGTPYYSQPSTVEDLCKYCGHTREEHTKLTGICKPKWFECNKPCFKFINAGINKK